jgi:hypothetical protein
LGALFNLNQKEEFTQQVEAHVWDSLLVSDLDLGRAEHEVVSGEKEAEI